MLDGSDYIGVRLWAGDDTPRTFTRCNLVNAEVPPGSTMIKCNTGIIRRGVVVDTEDVTVDAVLLFTIESKADIMYGSQTAPGVYDYLGTPIEDPLGNEE